MKQPLASCDAIREMFAQALSDMYEAEMPRYRQMGDLVRMVNEAALRADPETERKLKASGARDRLHLPQHGAIRVGTARELRDMRRLFAVMGMSPVGYYDLSTAGLPVHSTAFRPLGAEALRRSPFRVFASLLRLDLIEDDDVRREAAALMERRDILTPRFRALLDGCESEGGLDDARAAEFVSEAIETFRWRGAATTSAATYERLRTAHPLLADIVCFKGPHINHLTLRTLDIDAAQRAMIAAGLNPKPIIEGPPRRACPILLRQTSFKAQGEPFSVEGARDAGGLHMARFGEIEQRGAALTPKGRDLYDRLLADVHAQTPAPTSPETARGFEQTLERVFAAFPDGAAALWREKLAYFRFFPVVRDTPAGKSPSSPPSVDDLLAAGRLQLEPIVYEDFLPVSAAGIFRSNLSQAQTRLAGEGEDRLRFEAALESTIIDPQALYLDIERASLNAAMKTLGVE